MSTDPNLRYQSSKTYTHSVGLSCAFRQWRAQSHCRYIHGYALKVEVVFEGDLDERNWVMDFGGLKPLKQHLEYMFDHTLVVAEDDPNIMQFSYLSEAGLADVRYLPDVGCEKFAEYIFHWCDSNYVRSPSQPNWPLVQSVQVWEHEGNSAKVIRK